MVVLAMVRWLVSTLIDFQPTTLAVLVIATLLFVYRSLGNRDKSEGEDEDEEEKQV